MTRIATSMLLIGGLAGLAAAGTAGAATMLADGRQAVVVRFHRDTLTSESGTRALYRRLESAAALVCPAASDTRLVKESVQKCRQEALTAAVNKIHDQRLAELHAAAGSKSG